LLIGTYSRPDVERLRASGNRHLDWWEEAGANRQFKDAYAQADFGLRLGDHPHRIVTTTPRNTTKLRELIQEQDGSVVVTKGTIRDNPHLPAKKKAALIKLYAGTRIGRQELDGELLTDVPGALWTWAMIESAHASLPVPAPDYVRVVVAVDPATTSGEEADDTGIIVVAQGTDGRGYVLADRTCHLSPSGWAHRVVEVFDEFEADEVVAETNNGGDLVESLIRTVRRSIPYRKVHASRGKAIRAEPVAALYEQTRVSHCEVFGNLEAEITGWQPEDGDSPNRLDALVWGISSLGMFKQSKRWRMI
jgi:phage terminase large subunit-like protein